MIKNYNKSIKLNPFRFYSLYLFLSAILLSSCATKPIKINPRQIHSTTENYYLRAGDAIDIKFFVTPELNESVIIRPDGKISLQLIDDVRAEGLTVAELDELLTEEYEKHLNRALITVIVKTFEGQKVYIAGEVIRPGTIEITSRTNALQAIFEAGGFKDDAKKSKTIIISRGPENQPVIRVIDLKKALKGKLPENEYLLKPFDVVFIPKTGLAKADIVLQHIYRIISTRIWRGFTYETGENFQIDWDKVFYDY